MQRESVRPYVWMLLGCAAFTVMYALVHRLRENCDWQIIALFRTTLACLFAVGLARAAGAKLVFFGPRSLWIRSLAGSISLVCAFFAMTRNVPVSNVLAVTNVSPIWVALLAWPMLGMKPSWSVLLSVVTAVGGFWLICSPRIEGLYLHEATIATLFALVASVATAVAMLGLNQLRWIDTRAVVAHFSGVSVFFCLGVLAWFGLQKPLEGMANWKTILELLALGVAATAGQICLTKAFTIGAPAKVSVVGLTSIVMMLLVDVWLFGQHFTELNLLGIALVMVPTTWVIVSHRLGSRPVSETTGTLEVSGEW